MIPSPAWRFLDQRKRVTDSTARHLAHTKGGGGRCSLYETNDRIRQQREKGSCFIFVAKSSVV